MRKPKERKPRVGSRSVKLGHGLGLLDPLYAWTCTYTFPLKDGSTWERVSAWPLEAALAAATPPLRSRVIGMQDLKNPKSYPYVPEDLQVVVLQSPWEGVSLRQLLAVVCRRLWPLIGPADRQSEPELGRRLREQFNVELPRVLAGGVEVVEAELLLASLGVQDEH